MRRLKVLERWAKSPSGGATTGNIWVAGSWRFHCLIVAGPESPISVARLPQSFCLFCATCFSNASSLRLQRAWAYFELRRTATRTEHVRDRHRLGGILVLSRRETRSKARGPRETSSWLHSLHCDVCFIWEQQKLPCVSGAPVKSVDSRGGCWHRGRNLFCYSLADAGRVLVTVSTTKYLEMYCASHGTKLIQKSRSTVLIRQPSVH